MLSGPQSEPHVSVGAVVSLPILRDLVPSRIQRQESSGTGRPSGLQPGRVNGCAGSIPALPRLAEIVTRFMGMGETAGFNQRSVAIEGSHSLPNAHWSMLRSRRRSTEISFRFRLRIFAKIPWRAAWSGKGPDKLHLQALEPARPIAGQHALHADVVPLGWHCRPRSFRIDSSLFRYASAIHDSIPHPGSIMRYNEARVIGRMLY